MQVVYIQSLKVVIVSLKRLYTAVGAEYGKYETVVCFCMAHQVASIRGCSLCPKSFDFRMEKNGVCWGDESRLVKRH